MRYLIVTPSIVGKDGVSSLTRRVALAVSDGASDVEVWSLSDEPGSGFGSAGNDVTVRGASGSKARIIFWSLASLLRNCRDLTAVVMHAHLAPLSLPLRARGARVFQVLHGIEAWKPLSGLQARAVGAAERIVCVSAHTQKRFCEVNPGFDQTVVCHSGIEDRARSAAPGDDGFALIVGRMASTERYKGHDVLLDVWPDVVERAPQARLVVVGDGDDRERLMQRSLALGLSESIQFTGPLSDAELEGRYGRCSFFVMPSTHEGFGLVFLEAMRASKTCVGGIGAASEVIAHGETGFVVDPDDRGALTQILIDLFVQREKRVSMGVKGRERYERFFTHGRFRDRLQASLTMTDTH